MPFVSIFSRGPNCPVPSHQSQLHKVTKQIVHLLNAVFHTFHGPMFKFKHWLTSNIVQCKRVFADHPCRLAKMTWLYLVLSTLPSLRQMPLSSWSGTRSWEGFCWGFISCSPVIAAAASFRTLTGTCEISHAIFWKNFHFRAFNAQTRIPSNRSGFLTENEKSNNSPFFKRILWAYFLGSVGCASLLRHFHTGHSFICLGYVGTLFPLCFLCWFCIFLRLTFVWCKTGNPDWISISCKPIAHCFTLCCNACNGCWTIRWWTNE